MKYFCVFFLALLLLVGCSGEEKGRTLKIGDPAPMFVGVDLEGNSFSLKDFSGEPVIIRFWDSDCKFCKADTPVFNDLHRNYADQGLHIAYINTLSDLEEVERFIADLRVEFPVLMDEGGVIAQMYHIRVVPQTIVLNRAHTIVGAISGGVSEDVIVDLLAEELH